MSSPYIDEKNEEKEDINVETEETKETEEETKETEEETKETEEETKETEEETKEETTNDEKFDYRAYGKETVEETRNMAEKMLNDVVTTLKSKQTEWNKTLEEYKSTKPSVDLYELEDSLVIKVDVPRASKEDIDIKMSTESVEIEIDFPDDTPEDGVKVLRKERCIGKTKNTILLPVEVDVAKVKAEFENQVLTINLPKVQAKKVDVEIV